MNNLEILYEDNHVIVVVKKPNVLSQGDSTNDLDLLTMVKNYIKEKYQKPGNVYVGLVHRLDRPVGGVMVFAKTSKAASRLSEQIRLNQMHKSYYAVINGHLNEKEGTFVDKLLKLDNKKVIRSDEGKEAILNYKVISENGNHSLVDIDLVTGRFHQIRCQFAFRKHPLVGDQLYGVQDKKQIALFAYRLEFIHPTTKEKMIFTKKPYYGAFQEFDI